VQKGLKKRVTRSKQKADFETAKFGIYRQAESETRRLLASADRVTKDKREWMLHVTILDNLEEALRIARLHYEKK